MKEEPKKGTGGRNKLPPKEKRKQFGITIKQGDIKAVGGLKKAQAIAIKAVEEAAK